MAVEDGLRTESDPDSFLKVKECLIGFIMTLEVGRPPSTKLHWLKFANLAVSLLLDGFLA
jgi:hypothetical protein